MYTRETLNKYLLQMHDAIEQYRAMTDADFANVHLVVSKGNKKIGKVLNVSLPAVLTCGPNCKGCKEFCYDIKACLQYKNVLNARAKNFVLLERDEQRFFKELRQAMNKRKTNKYLRFHVGGDIKDILYFHRIVNDIARVYPDWTIWTYTKQYDIVNRYIEIMGPLPDNLTIMFSEWRGLPMVNPNGFPEFRVVFKGEEKPKGAYCPGNCDICKATKGGCIGGHTTYCLEH